MNSALRFVIIPGVLGWTGWREWEKKESSSRDPRVLKLKNSKDNGVPAISAGSALHSQVPHFHQDGRLVPSRLVPSPSERLVNNRDSSAAEVSPDHALGAAPSAPLTWILCRSC